jgi:hypothetical protein
LQFVQLNFFLNKTLLIKVFEKPGKKFLLQRGHLIKPIIKIPITNKKYQDTIIIAAKFKLLKIQNISKVAGK